MKDYIEIIIWSVLAMTAVIGIIVWLIHRAKRTTEKTNEKDIIKNEEER